MTLPANPFKLMLNIKQPNANHTSHKNYRKLNQGIALNPMVRLATTMMAKIAVFVMITL